MGIKSQEIYAESCIIYFKIDFNIEHNLKIVFEKEKIEIEIAYSAPKPKPLTILSKIYQTQQVTLQKVFLVQYKCGQLPKHLQYFVSQMNSSVLTEKQEQPLSHSLLKTINKMIKLECQKSTELQKLRKQMNELKEMLPQMIERFLTGEYFRGRQQQLILESNFGSYVCKTIKDISEKLELVREEIDDLEVLETPQMMMAREEQKNEEENQKGPIMQDGKLESIIDQNSKYIKSFKLENSIVELLESDPCQILGKIPLENLQNRFTIQNKPGKIYIGIINRDHIDDRDSTDGKKKGRDLIAYNVWNGHIKYGEQNKKDGIGAQPKETLVMKVQGSTISWECNKEVRGQLTDPSIADKSKNWVPFIMMTKKGSKIKWEIHQL